MMRFKTWQQLAASLIKAAERAGHKYIRREPKPGGGYRYYYSEARTAAKVERGHRIRIGKHAHDVEHVDDKGHVTLKHTKTGKREKVHASELHRRLHEAYRDRYERGAERMAKRILRQVEGVKLDDIKADPLKAWRKLGKRFTDAGVPKGQALALLRTLGRAKGWGSDAKVMFASLASDKRLGRYVTQSRDQLMRGAANLAKGEQKRLEIDQPFTLAPVRPKHVMMAVKSRLPENGGSAGDKAVELLNNAAGELGKLEAMLTALEAVGPAAPDALKHYADAALKSDALAELSVAVDAYPGLANSKEAKKLRELEGRHHALTAAHGKAKSDGGRGIPGVDTTVFVADKQGNPTPQRAKYRLVEAGDVTPSHAPTKDIGESWAKRKGYPPGVQERQYHDDIEERKKVQKQATNMHPGLHVNTNPDATNGPPIVDQNGIVLGGNSRTMAVELAHQQGGKSSKAYRDHLRKHAGTFGLTAAEVDGMKAPMLIREVDTGNASKQDMSVLVRRYNESFTQEMDPRTEQVAKSKLVTDDMMQTLARGMVDEEGEPKHKTLNAYLRSGDSAPFVAAMERAGIIDDRNRSRYAHKRKTAKDPLRLNEDGNRLVESLLVGKVVDDADILSNVSSRQMKALAASMPHIIRAKGSGHDVTEDLRNAMAGDHYRRVAGFKTPEAMLAQKELNDAARDAGFGEAPKLSPAAVHILHTLHNKPGYKQAAKYWREFAKHAADNPAGQADVFGVGKKTHELLGEVRSGKHKEAKMVPRTRGEREAAEAAVEEEAAERARAEEAKRAQPAMMFSFWRVADLAKAAIQRDMFGGPSVAVDTGARAKQGRQMGLFGDEPKKPEEDKKKRKGVIFTGPRGGRYLDPAHTIPAKHDNPHGDKLKRGVVIRGPKGHLHEVKHVGAHHKTGKVHALVHTPRGPQTFAATKIAIHRGGRKAGQAGLFAGVFRSIRERMSKGRPPAYLRTAIGLAEYHGGDVQKVEAALARQHPKWTASATGKQDIRYAIEAYKKREQVGEEKPRQPEKPAGDVKPKPTEKPAQRKTTTRDVGSGVVRHDMEGAPPSYHHKDSARTAKVLVNSDGTAYVQAKTLEDKTTGRGVGAMGVSGNKYASAEEAHRVAKHWAKTGRHPGGVEPAETGWSADQLAVARGKQEEKPKPLGVSIGAPKPAAMPAKPPGAGWQPIPKPRAGKRGWRRRKGKGYEYDYGERAGRKPKGAPQQLKLLSFGGLGELVKARLGL